MRLGKSCVVIVVYIFAIFSGYAFGFREFDAKAIFHKWENIESEFRRAFHEISIHQKINMADRFELNLYTRENLLCDLFVPCDVQNGDRDGRCVCCGASILRRA